MKTLEELFKVERTNLIGGKLFEYVNREYPICLDNEGIAMSSGCAACAAGGEGKPSNKDNYEINYNP